MFIACDADPCRILLPSGGPWGFNAAASEATLSETSSSPYQPHRGSERPSFIQGITLTQLAYLKVHLFAVSFLGKEENGPFLFWPIVLSAKAHCSIIKRYLMQLPALPLIMRLSISLKLNGTSPELCSSRTHLSPQPTAEESHDPPTEGICTGKLNSLVADDCNYRLQVEGVRGLGDF